MLAPGMSTEAAGRHHMPAQSVRGSVSVGLQQHTPSVRQYRAVRYTNASLPPLLLVPQDWLDRTGGDTGCSFFRVLQRLRPRGAASAVA